MEANVEHLTLEQVRERAGTGGFVPYEGNPVLTVEEGAWDAGALGSMTVVKVGDLLHLYYEAWGRRSEKQWDHDEYSTLQIGHATSVDGIRWEKDPANPVLTCGAEADAWDRDGTWDPFVLHEGGVFKLWYGGGNDVCDWGYAESTDGAHFVKRGRISRLGRVEDDHVVRDPKTGRFHLYYWDRAHEPMGLFRATSPNETDFDFERAVPIVIGGETYPGRYKFTHVFIEDGRWYMLYSNFVRPHCPDSSVRLAISADGLNWTRANGCLVEGHDGEMVKLDSDLHALYYGPRDRFDAKGCDIRVAFFNGTLETLAGRPARGAP